jgi:hypothetical protein
MLITSTSIRAAAALVLAAAPIIAFTQGPAGAGGGRQLSVELQALNPPVPEDLVLEEARSVPAEQLAAADNDIDWAPPATSWGHTSLEGTWSTDDMRAIPFDRSRQYGTQEFLNQDDFIARARQQQAGSEHSEEVETFHRNSWGIRSFVYSSLVVYPPDGRTPPLTAAGRARAAAVAGRGTFGNGPFNAYEDFSLYDRCIARGLAAGLGAVLYGNGIVIAQSPNAIAITYEMIHETRVIPLDSRPHLDPAILQYTGNGRGRWEGDTLVIETAGFNDQISLASGAPPSPSMRTTERLRRIDPEMIEYRITIDDPETYTAPFTARIIWTEQPGYTVYEYSCHEGNYAVLGGLAGEREFERRVEEARAEGLPIPRRSTMNEVYGIPSEDTRIYDINKGE